MFHLLLLYRKDLIHSDKYGLLSTVSVLDTGFMVNVEKTAFVFTVRLNCF